MSHSQLLVLFLLTVQNFSIFDCKEYHQSDFGVDHLVMSMCSIFTCVVERGCLVLSGRFLAKFCQPLPCFILYSKAKLACYSRYLLTSYLAFQSPMMKRTSFFGVSSRRSCRSSQNCSTSFSVALLVEAQTWITVILNGLPWK